jgi:hypothetical protein
MNATVVFHGKPLEGKEGRYYCEGWTAGHDDASQNLPWDSTLAMERSWFAEGYRDGYEDQIRWRNQPEQPRTLVGLGTAA